MATYFFVLRLIQFSQVAVKYGGVGHHLQAVPPEVRLYSVKTCFIAAPILYSITAALPKLAILATYLKIFVDKFSRICCHITGLIIILTAIANVLDTIFQCIPMSYLWDKSDPNGHCINLELHYRYGSLPNIVTDCLCLCSLFPSFGSSVCLGRWSLV